jgi:hypothetical protein
MLSPTDVRVGNWVLKIMGVDKKKDSFFEYQAIALDEYYYTFSSVCFPIPLSAGVLGYCGFKHEFGDWYKPIGTEGINDGLSPLKYKNQTRAWYLNDHRIPAQPIYVHQLQNLYYVLTGQELDIDLGLYKNLPLFGPIEFFAPKEPKELIRDLL